MARQAQLQQPCASRARQEPTPFLQAPQHARHVLPGPTLGGLDPQRAVRVLQDRTQTQPAPPLAQAAKQDHTTALQALHHRPCAPRAPTDRNLTPAAPRRARCALLKSRTRSPDTPSVARGAPLPILSPTLQCASLVFQAPSPQTTTLCVLSAHLGLFLSTSTAQLLAVAVGLGPSLRS